ncbi:alpha-galactosidase [Actinoplanes sp. NPDC026670]|uniref:alpha-galactosidase n=1 Tax=Actinoplanes sp. NPDC026670 TaxID=3154700 RepID=UPI0033FCE5A1
MSLAWGPLVIDTPVDGPVTARLASATERPGAANQPIVEVLAAGSGRGHVSARFSQTVIGRRFRLAHSFPGARELRLRLHDAESGLTAEVVVSASLRVETTIINDGTAPVLLLGVTTFALGLGPVDDLDLVSGDGEWLGEGRWTRRPLRELVPDLNLRMHGQDGRGRHAVTSTGTWSTGAHQPAGVLADRVTGAAVAWQVEHNGAWRWETGEQLGGAYLALTGPNDIDHQWQQPLAPGESFTTVPASIAVGGGLHGAVAALTAQRRTLRQPDRALPVIFNDYMNTLMGDPTTAKLLPLIDAAAAAGAEIFCIDAGWYDNDTTWWDSVGEWQPSTTRFPGGLAEVVDRIRAHAMVPGLWLEPEVIGVRSPMADKLPAEAFLQRGGVRLVEHGRYHLDLRHPAAIAHLDEVVDRLVEQFGAGYFKFDYNIDPGTGTDLAAHSAGAGLLDHNRAHLAWLDGVLARHPGLILENCASGGMRADYALLSRMHLQSTSDQQDFRKYPPIAVSAPLSILPEQAASWAYPQPDMTDAEIAFTMCTGLLGRLYLSGRLDAMTPDQQRLVRDGVDAFRAIRAGLAATVPVWPLGLPGWDDSWLALGLHSGDTTHLGLWRRPGASAEVTIDLEHLRGRRVELDVLYPNRAVVWPCHWNTETGSLTVTTTPGEPYAARILRIRVLPETEGSR